MSSSPYGGLIGDLRLVRGGTSSRDRRSAAPPAVIYVAAEDLGEAPPEAEVLARGRAAYRHTCDCLKPEPPHVGVEA